MMQDPWALFDNALEMTGTARREALESVLDLCSADSASKDPDQVELIATVKAELARCGALALEEATDAVAEAMVAGRSGWPNCYLAEAASQLGYPKLVIACVSRIPLDFFESRDLGWRAYRCHELEAVAQIDLGEWQRAERVVDGFASAYALRGDEEDLAPPRDLVSKLVSAMPRSRRALGTLAASVELASWVGPILAEAALNALAQCDGAIS